MHGMLTDDLVKLLPRSPNDTYLGDIWRHDHTTRNRVVSAVKSRSVCFRVTNTPSALASNVLRL